MLSSWKGAEWATLVRFSDKTQHIRLHLIPSLLLHLSSFGCCCSTYDDTKLLNYGFKIFCWVLPSFLDSWVVRNSCGTWQTLYFFFLLQNWFWAFSWQCLRKGRWRGEINWIYQAEIGDCFYAYIEVDSCTSCDGKIWSWKMFNIISTTAREKNKRRWKKERERKKWATLRRASIFYGANLEIPLCGLGRPTSTAEKGEIMKNKQITMLLESLTVARHTSTKLLFFTETGEGLKNYGYCWRTSEGA